MPIDKWVPLLLGSATTRKRKKKKHRSITNTKITWKTQIGKNHEAAHKFTIIREIIRDKKRILTTALYNDTHNKLMFHQSEP